MEYIYLDISHIMKKFIPCLIVVVSIIMLSSIGCARVENSQPPKHNVIWEISYKMDGAIYTVRLTGTEDSYYSIYSKPPITILTVYLNKEMSFVMLIQKTKGTLEVLYFKQIEIENLK